MIRLEKIYKSYNNRDVLKDVNLNFGNKGLYVIIGASGSGKSTLLNLIGLLDKPDKGNIYFEGKDINKYSYKEIIKYHKNSVGFIFQDYHLINDMTVEENLSLLGINNCKSILRSLKLTKYSNTIVSNLSGGEQQRVAIARALVKRPKVLLCDEPTGALDSANGKQIMEILKKVSKSSLVILVTHNNKYAEEYGDYIINIKDGIVDNINVNDKDINFNNYQNNKSNKIKLKSLLNLIKINFKRKKKRNILTIIAFLISFIALSLVLGIKNGFNDSLEKQERDSLSKYPIYISKYSTNLDDEINNIFKEKEINNEDKIYAVQYEHQNTIDRDYINYINNYEYSEKVFGYNISNSFQLISYYNQFYDDLEYVTGSKINDDNDVLMIVDSNNNIDYNLLYSIGFNNNVYNYDDIINYEYKLDNKKYKIVGIYKIKEDDEAKYVSGLYYHKNNFKEDIPTDIYLYVDNYNSKCKLKKYLNKYSDVFYSDYASTIKNLSQTVVNSISVILICFCVISFIVLIIMISILSYISIMERKKEIGILKSIGYSNNNIKLLFYIENIIIVYFSSLISIEFVDITSIFINKFLEKLTGLNNVISLSYTNMFTIIIIGLFLAYFGSYFPVKRVNKTNIIDTLK